MAITDSAKAALIGFQMDYEMQNRCGNTVTGYLRSSADAIGTV
jgi:hypothetical protein